MLLDVSHLVVLRLPSFCVELDRGFVCVYVHMCTNGMKFELPPLSGSLHALFPNSPGDKAKSVCLMLLHKNKGTRRVLQQLLNYRCGCQLANQGMQILEMALEMLNPRL